MGGGPATETILIPMREVPKDILSRLQNKFPKADIHHIQTGNADEVPKHLWQAATVLVTFSTFPKKLEDVPNLALVHLVSAGSNQMQEQPLYTDSEVIITTSSGIHGPQIAEWVIMTALVQSHGYKELYELQKKKQWGAFNAQADYHAVRDKVGKRIGILGYGSIGRQVGRVAKAMGMEVVAYTASKKDTPEKKKDGGFIVPGTGDPEGDIPVEWFDGLDKSSLQNFLKQDLDWLVVSVPLTPQTLHFLSKDEFTTLGQGGKKPAFVTNIARGPILDQPALIEALKDGTLAGAALDVTDPEPLPEDSELWGLENVIVTPHVSGSGVDYLDRTFQILEINLGRRERGERLLNVVNRKRGY